MMCSRQVSCHRHGGLVFEHQHSTLESCRWHKGLVYVSQWTMQGYVRRHKDLLYARPPLGKGSECGRRHPCQGRKVELGTLAVPLTPARARQAALVCHWDWKYKVRVSKILR